MMWPSSTRSGGDRDADLFLSLADEGLNHWLASFQMTGGKMVGAAGLSAADPREHA
jgi:hypothetical protein